MRLTVVQLKTLLELRLVDMTTEMKASSYDRGQLHERVDRLLLNFEAFRKETRDNFSEVRSDIAEMRSDIAEIRSDIAEMRSDIAEMRSDIAEIRSDIAEMRSDFAVMKELLRTFIDSLGDYSNRVERRFRRIETHVGLEPFVDQPNDPSP